MNDGPTTEWVRCDHCEAEAVAVLPPNSTTVRDGDRSDGKAWVNCWDCDDRFLVYYERNGPD